MGNFPDHRYRHRGGILCYQSSVAVGIRLCLWRLEWHRRCSHPLP